MARPRIYDEPRVATAVRLPVSLHDELRQAARKRDVSVNLLITRAVTDLLTRLPEPLPEADQARASAPHPGTARG